MAANSNYGINEPCEGRLCGSAGICDLHVVNVSLIEGRTAKDIREPAIGSIVLVEGVAIQSGLLPEEENVWAYVHDLQVEYASWEDIAMRAVLIYKADATWTEGFVWQEGMPCS